MGNRVCQWLKWGLWHLLRSPSTAIIQSSTCSSVWETNPLGFSLLRNLLVVAFSSRKLAAGREGHNSASVLRTLQKKKNYNFPSLDNMRMATLKLANPGRAKWTWSQDPPAFHLPRAVLDMDELTVHDTKALSNSVSSTYQRDTLLSKHLVTMDASQVPSLEVALDKLLTGRVEPSLV